VMGPFLLDIFFPGQDALSQLTGSVLTGVAVTLLGIAIIGVAGSMRAS
ncbi:MAG TPA: rhamnose/proton symporter RhaT, partial [Prevotellaceae bacterium]|nr:rhamnose/proton symporter RhaT [Prevotellaceae bacterium]